MQVISTLLCTQLHNNRQRFMISSMIVGILRRSHQPIMDIGKVYNDIFAYLYVAALLDTFAPHHVDNITVPLAQFFLLLLANIAKSRQVVLRQRRGAG